MNTTIKPKFNRGDLVRFTNPKMTAKFGLGLIVDREFEPKRSAFDTNWFYTIYYAKSCVAYEDEPESIFVLVSSRSTDV